MIEKDLVSLSNFHNPYYNLAYLAESNDNYETLSVQNTAKADKTWQKLLRIKQSMILILPNFMNSHILVIKGKLQQTCVNT